MSVEIQVSAWSDVTVAYCTGRVERRADIAPIAGAIAHYAGWCETLVLDLSPLRISDPSFVFELREAASSARAAGTRVLMRLNPVRHADAMASLQADIADSLLFQPL